VQFDGNDNDHIHIVIRYFCIVVLFSLILLCVTGCSTKVVNNGKFDCNCNCAENSFECRLEIDKETKILHQEGEEDGSNN